MKCDTTGGRSVDELQAEVVFRTGLALIDDRYILLDAKGDIVEAVTIDPACNDAKIHEAAGLTVQLHKTASPGWKLDPATQKFVPPAPTAEQLASRAATKTLEDAAGVVSENP